MKIYLRSCLCYSTKKCIFVQAYVTIRYTCEKTGNPILQKTRKEIYICQ